VLNPKEKPEILLVLANDGWYGVSAGPYQHLAAAQMRAVEEGVTVIRSANTGISAVIDMNGVILGKIGLNEMNIADVSLPRPFSRPTFYGKYGNIIPMALLLLILVLTLGLNKVLNKTK
jgi:apolipoprotein N-acyltransferase